MRLCKVVLKSSKKYTHDDRFKELVVLRAFNRRYTGITQEMVSVFRMHCHVCYLKQSQYVQIDDYRTRYKKISLREAAALSANRGDSAEIITSCNCNNVCTDDNRCKCL